MAHRDVDLVVPRDSDMDALLKFLIHKLRTIDGCRGSAEKIIETLQAQCETEYKRAKGKNHISASV